MPTVQKSPSGFIPTTSVSGGGGATLWRGKNVRVLGTGTGYTTICYNGELDLSETIATKTLTGTLSITSGSKSVTGTGTAFRSELRNGQFILLGANLLVVDTVSRTSDTALTVVTAATATVAGGTGYVLPVIFELNKKRGTLIRGNAQEYDKGTIAAVGDGELNVNGTALTASLTATRELQLAVYNPAGNDYDIYALGMDTPAAGSFSLANVANADPINMVGGLYGLRFVPSRTATGGYNNPTENYTVTVSDGQFQIEVDVSGAPFDTTHGQDAWDVYGTLVGPAQGYRGPWYYIKTVTAADITADKFYITYLDGEIAGNDLLSYDNDPPVDAEFVGSLANVYPILISAQGQGYSSTASTSPGPFIIPARFSNPEAFPLRNNAVAGSPPETIVGFVSGLALLYLLTPNHLLIASFATTDTRLPALTIRPFWKTGFRNPYQLTLVNGMLYGWSAGTPMRSLADGDEQDAQSEWARDVAAITRTWKDGNVLVAYDTRNDCVCYFHAADSLNSNNWWRTVCLCYDLQNQFWHPPFYLERTDKDFIVSGAATVDGHLAILAGGRTSGAPVVKTYYFDEGTGQSIDAFMAWQLSDEGSEGYDKFIKAVRVSGKWTSGTAKIYGTRANTAISVTDVDAGTNALASVSLGTVSSRTRGRRVPVEVKNLTNWTIRVGTTWAGTGESDGFDEAAVEIIQRGGRR